MLAHYNRNLASAASTQICHRKDLVLKGLRMPHSLIVSTQKP